MSETELTPQFPSLGCRNQTMKDARTLTAEQTERLAQVATLYAGAGKNGLADACLMQAVDWVYRNADHWTDTPECTPPTLRRFAIRLNDARWPSDEVRTEVLKPLIPLLVGADASSGAEQKRMWLFADFAVREAAPYWFDWLADQTKKAVYREWAKKMRDVVPITDKATALAARGVAREVRNAAAAADDAYAAAAAYAADASDAYAAYAAADAADAADAYAAYAAADDAYAAVRLPILKRAADVLAQACAIKQ